MQSTRCALHEVQSHTVIDNAKKLLLVSVGTVGAFPHNASVDRMTAQNRTEIELFQVWSEDWQCNMPVTLIEWDDETHDLHCQTGDHHMAAIDKAEEMLYNTFRLRIQRKDFYMTGPSGVYYPLEQVKDERT